MDSLPKLSCLTIRVSGAKIELASTKFDFDEKWCWSSLNFIDLFVLAGGVILEQDENKRLIAKPYNPNEVGKKEDEGTA